CRLKTQFENFASWFFPFFCQLVRTNARECKVVSTDNVFNQQRHVFFVTTVFRESLPKLHQAGLTARGEFNFGRSRCCRRRRTGGEIIVITKSARKFSLAE